MTQKPQRPLITITAPLPGWIRLQHTRTGLTLDFNPEDEVHQKLLSIYRDSPVWEEVKV